MSNYRSMFLCLYLNVLYLKTQHYEILVYCRLFYLSKRHLSTLILSLQLTHFYLHKRVRQQYLLCRSKRQTRALWYIAWVYIENMLSLYFVHIEPKGGVIISHGFISSKFKLGGYGIFTLCRTTEKHISTTCHEMFCHATGTTYFNGMPQMSERAFAVNIEPAYLCLYHL